MNARVERNLSIFEKYLTAWVIGCIASGIIFGKLAPGIVKYLDGLAIYANKAPVVSIPIATCLFLWKNRVNSYLK